MKHTKHILLIALTVLFVACGPDKAGLRTELQSIDAEMVRLRIAAEQQRAQMDQAEFNTFIGSFAAGYGATSGDHELAGEGVGTAVDSSRQYDASRYSHEQLSQRYGALAKRREQIVKQLN